MQHKIVFQILEGTDPTLILLSIENTVLMSWNLPILKIFLMILLEMPLMFYNV